MVHAIDDIKVHEKTEDSYGINTETSYQLNTAKTTGYHHLSFLDL